MKIKIFIILITLILIISLALSACYFPPRNILLLHRESISGSGSPNYLGGASGVYINRNYAYITSYDEDTLSIFYIRNRTNPIQLNSISGITSMD